MKASAVIRVIIWSIVALLLLSILITGITGGFGGIFNWRNWFSINVNNGGGNVNNSGNYSSYDDSVYTVGGGSVNSTGIRNISIDWLSGRVEVIPTDGDTITFSETSNVDLDSDYIMRYRVDGNTLKIRFARSRVSFVGLFRSLNKTLTVYVPRSLSLDDFAIDNVSSSIDVEGINAGEFYIDSVSGRIDLRNITTREMEIEVVSGSIEGSGITADRLKVNSVSGGIQFSDSRFREIDTESVSGSTEVASKTMPTKSSMEAISGSMTLIIPENDGFTARCDRVSGSFNCEFEGTITKNSAVYKDGSATIEFDSVSGSMNIRRG